MTFEPSVLIPYLTIVFMSLSSVELWQRISSAGLAAPMICRSWAAEALQELQPSDAANADKILEQLVLNKRLTDYQADLIAGRREGEYRRGAWTLLQPVETPLWSGWFEAVKSPTEEPTWLRWLSSEALNEFQNAAPSLPRGLRLAQTKGPNLQGVFVPELIDKQLQLQMAPLRGKPLMLAVLSDASVGQQAAEIVRQVAEALRPMHAAQLAHGRVMPDRVYIEASNITLARDPICCNTGSLDERNVGVIESGLQGLSPAQFMAPEFLAPGQQPTLSSDIYSLGCLWWWLLTGKPLVAGSTLDKQLARQAEASIALPKDSLISPPLLRCLQHCLAKNLQARFASAESLCIALDAAFAAVAKGPVLRQKSVAAKPSAATKPIEPVKLKEQSVTPNKIAPAAAQADYPVPNRAASVTVPATPQKPSKAEIVKPVEVKQLAVTQADVKQLDVKQPEVKATDVKPAAKPQLKPEVLVKASVENLVEAEAAQSQVAEPVRTAQVEPATNVAAVNLNPAAANESEFVVPQVTRKPVAKSGNRKKAKRNPANKWALPVIGGLVATCLLLGVLIMSGALKSTGRRTEPQRTDIANNPVDNNLAAAVPSDAKPATTDPLLDLYRIVDSGKELPWVPPAAPKPISLDLLPPGGQMFLTLQPSRLLKGSTSKSLLAALNQDVDGYLERIRKNAGVPLEAIERVTVAFFAENEVLMTCMRVQLVNSQSLADLRNAWGAPADEKVESLTLLSNAEGQSYFVAQQPLTDAQSVREFSVGPAALMREALELKGAAGPLVSQLEKLWEVSDADADISLLVTTPFLFSDGKALLAMAPKRMSSRLRELLEVDTRALLVQTRFEPTWFIEAQLVGPSEREAPRLREQLKQKIVDAPTAIEDWFVSEQPHPYWRSLAIRYPQMLRAFAEQARFGIERGAAVANVYLPPEAANNILLSTWIAAQDGATLASDAPMEVAAISAEKPMTIEEYLARPIKLSFDQEPIESALRLVGEEANANLPPGTPQLRFALDGGAFERAGITRNQQLRDFKHDGLPMRDALTAIAKRGNPVTTVKDTREEEQRLLWVVRDDPERPGKQMISLTTRVEATTNKIPLPVEFAAPK